MNFDVLFMHRFGEQYGHFTGTRYRQRPLSVFEDRASKEKRSISQDVIFILEKYLARPKSMDVSPTEEFI